MEYIVKLKPESPFHVGEAGIGLEEASATVHSDTLFSAVCNMYVLLYGEDELEAMLKEFDEDPPFLLSSAFLHVGGIFTFPAPIGLKWADFLTKRGERVEGDYETVKKLRKVQFVSRGTFQSIMKRSLEIESPIIVQNILFSEGENPHEKIFVINEIPRVAMDRLSSVSSIYHVGEVNYAPECGLYFFLKTTPQCDKKIKASIYLLGDEGLGGKRSSGRGLFAPTFEENSIRIALSSTKITLSLIFPQEKEVPLVKEGSYGLLSRKGWIYTPRSKSLRKKGVRMLTEGSQFPERVVGRIVDVTPQSVKGIPRIVRYGLGYYLQESEGND